MTSFFFFYVYKVYILYYLQVTDFWNALMFSADIINGPTLGKELPPFRWSEFASASHVGLPPVYNFSFINTKPENVF